MSDEVELVVIVDDDEQLFRNAIEILKTYKEKYACTNCGVIHFNRKDENGNVIADPLISEDMFCTYQKFKSKGYRVDGYIAYFYKKLSNKRLGEYSNEKYVGPSTLMMKVSRNYELIFAEAVLGHTEYLEGGISKQGRRLRIRNPLGMIEYCALMQENGASFKNRIIYSINGYAYAALAKDLTPVRNYMGCFLGFCKIPGILLAHLWIKKYKQ